MTEQEILRHMGMSETDVKELLQKFNDFANGLKPVQKRAFLRSLKDCDEGARELGGNVTPHQLETFLRKFAPPEGILCCWCEDVLRHKHE